LPTLNVEASDRGRWRALHKALLTTMAGGREQLVGLDWGAVTVEPYQLVPLMRVARSMRPRLLIADDTGLGKTAEAGLILRWLAQRHQAGRVLIVTRAAPEPQRWQSELWTKFGFDFDILANGADFLERRKQAPTVNVFAQQPRLIVSMTLAARQIFLDELRQCPSPFDVIVVDEAHHLAERGSRTKRLALLGRALSRACADGAFLLLTATPHDGKTESFLSLLRLLDPLVESGPSEVPLQMASRLIVRRLKSEVTLAGGKSFIPPVIHVVSTLSDASKQERALDEPLNRYLEWLAAEERRCEVEGARQKAKGCQFLAGVYRKRLGSSVAALRATLRRRLDLPPASEDADEAVPFVDTDASDPEDDIIDPGVASEAPPPPLDPREAELAQAVLSAADAVPEGRDSKLQALKRLLAGEVAGEKVVVFTEYRDTLRAARRLLEREDIPFVTFHGETAEKDREHAISAFLSDPSARVFLATDAASEGKNLQRSAHHLVHLDVPWNPNRYAQRNGRIDRYGQSEEPHIWVLVAADRKKGEGRPEYRALELVVEKLNRIQKELGSVGPILPGLTSGSVMDVLLRAETDAEEKLERMLEDPSLRRVEEDLSRLTVTNQRDIDDAEAHVANFGTSDDFEAELGSLLATAFRAWDDGGTIEALGSGLVRVAVPGRLRDMLGRVTIERATFARGIAVARQDDDENAPEFLSPGHPLVEAALRLLRDEAADPAFVHRFDVEVGSPESLVCSFLLRFVDGDGRTVEERLDAVDVGLTGSTSGSPEEDLVRLGLDAPGSGMNPDRDAIERWRASYPVLVDAARAEAERRAELRRRELVELATRLREEELEALAVWRYEEREPRPSPRRARRSCKRLPECRLNPDSRSPQEEQV
jgi:superfamily II DNA or RNA helicase